MNFMQVGLITIIGGGLLATYSIKLGGAVAVLGLVVFVLGEDKEDNKKQPKQEQKQDVQYKVIEGQIVMTDSQGNVLGVAQPEKAQRKLVGSNKK